MQVLRSVLHTTHYCGYHQITLHGEEIGCLSITGGYASRPQTSQCGICSCYYEDVDHYAHNMGSSHGKEKKKRDAKIPFLLYIKNYRLLYATTNLQILFQDGIMLEQVGQRYHHIWGGDKLLVLFC